MLSDQDKSIVETWSAELADAQPAAVPAPETEHPAKQAEASPEPPPPPESAAAAAAPATEGEASPPTPEALDQLIEQYSAPQQATAEGELVEGRVIAITDLGVVVDIGSKSEGLIPAQEFVEHEGVPPLEPGQAVEVQLLNEEKEGYILVSYQRARRRRAWQNIEKSYREHVPLVGLVVDRIKGGLVVDIGIRAFLPASQVDLRPVHDVDAWKGQQISCRVLKMNRKRGNVVVSRRAVLEEELQAQRKRLIESLAEGQVLAGKVKNITDYGVFVDLGGLDGLLHITDLSWSRLKHPSEVVSPGQEIEIKVLKFDRERMRVSLGRKQLLPDPWATIPERYPVGTRVHGRVVGIADYGAFVELEPGVEGLVHISEMSWSKRMKHPSKIVSLGDMVEVVVLDVRPEQRRISLGLKQTMPDPWLTLVEKYPVGTLVTGRVRNLTDFGAFIEIEDGIDGLVHVSNLSWTKRVKHPSEVLKKGDRVKAVVLAIEPDKRRLSLGVKQLQPDVWETFFQQRHVGDVLHGKVLRVASFGAFVEIAEGIEGLCHNSEAVDANGQPIHLEPGQEHDFKIIKMNPDEKKVGLSIRAVGEEASRTEVEAYKHPVSSTGGSTIGELMSWKRAGNENN